MIELLLAFSMIVNGFLIWYIIQLLKRFLNVSDELENFFVLLEEFTEHIDVVNSMEKFYGDSTLENLMKHSKAISDAANEFRTLYDVGYVLEEEDE